MALLIKRMAWNNIAPAQLAAWLGAANKGNLYVLTAVGTGDIKNKRLRHYSFGNGGNHRVNAIQAIIQHVKALLDALDVQRLAGSRCELNFLRQSDTS
jgi:hypothetical protein